MVEDGLHDIVSANTSSITIPSFVLSSWLLWCSSEEWTRPLQHEVKDYDGDVEDLGLSFTVTGREGEVELVSAL